MTKHELKVIKLLAEAYQSFSELEVYHPEDDGEFVRAVHAAQNIVMARAAVRRQPDFFVKVGS
jgi:hypothetical protein